MKLRLKQFFRDIITETVISDYRKKVRLYGSLYGRSGSDFRAWERDMHHYAQNDWERVAGCGSVCSIGEWDRKYAYIASGKG